MPVIVVETLEGKTDDQKAKIISGITKVFTDVGVPADQVTIIIPDVPKASWGANGKPS